MINFLATVKSLLQIPQDDTSKDQILTTFLNLAREKILTYCNRSDLPKGLYTVYCQVAANCYLESETKQQGGRLASVQEGGRSVSFFNETATSTVNDMIASNRELFDNYKEWYRI